MLYLASKRYPVLEKQNPKLACSCTTSGQRPGRLGSAGTIVRVPGSGFSSMEPQGTCTLDMVAQRSQNVLSDPDGRGKASFELASKAPEHHFSHILLFSFLKSRLMGSGETDSVSPCGKRRSLMDNPIDGGRLGPSAQSHHEHLNVAGLRAGD